MTYHRIISGVLVPATLLLFTGCTKTAWVAPEDVRPEQQIKGVVSADAREVTLDPRATSLRGDTIYAEVNGDTLGFALAELDRVGIARTDVLASIGLGLGLAAAAFVVVVGGIALEDFEVLGATPSTPK